MTFGLCTRKVALLPNTQDRKPDVFGDPCIAQAKDFDPSWHLMAPLRHRANKKGTQRFR